MDHLSELLSLQQLAVNFKQKCNHYVALEENTELASFLCLESQPVCTSDTSSTAAIRFCMKPKHYTFYSSLHSVRLFLGDSSPK